MKSGMGEKASRESFARFSRTAIGSESKDQSPHGIRLIQTGNVGGGVFKDRAEESALHFECDIQTSAVHGDFRGRLPNLAIA